jgi:cytochrome b561
MDTVKTRYDSVQVTLHWLIALMIIGMIGLGLFMVELPKQSELPPGEESVRAFYFLLHKSLGITVAGLILIRILWRLTHTAPALPETISTWQQKAAGAVHGLLYFVMIATPVSGYLQSSLSKYPTKFWGIELPRVAEANETLRETFTEIHEVFAFLFIALIVIHLLAVVKHRLEGANLLTRMSFRNPD